MTTTLRRAGTAAALVAALVCVAMAQGAGQDDKQFQAALQKEMVAGDLKGAIVEYRLIADRPGVSRALAAEALFRMAQCYEKLGQMAATAELEKVWTGTDLADVSPDGRYMTHYGARADVLRLRNLATGEEHALTAEPPTTRIFLSKFSRDGREIAYTQCTIGPQGPRNCELRVVSARPGARPASRRVLAREGTYPIPTDWSPDGKWIAANLRRDDRTETQAVLLNIADGTVNQLTTVAWDRIPTIVFSPDSRDVAVGLQADGSADLDVRVMATDGTRSVLAAALPGDDSPVGWTPDGMHLLFVNDRRGGDLWAQPWSGRERRGTPRLVKLDVSSAPVRVTVSGDLYVATTRAEWTVELGSVDLTTGNQTSPAVRAIERTRGFATQPAWSPDGRSLAYVFNPMSGQTVIGIRSNDTGATREVHFQPRLSNVQALSWARDGQSFLAAAHDDKSRPGVFRVTLNGDVTRLLERPNFAWDGFFSTPDARRMIYRMQRDGAIHEYDFASGTDRVMIPGGADDASGRLGTMSLSPDGRLIATSRVDAATGSRALVLVPYGGGTPRELMRAAQAQQLIPADWTPDGRALLVVKSSADVAKGKELWLVPVDGTVARKLDVDVSRLAEGQGRLRLHADGRQLAFVTGGSEKAIWVYRDALQALRATP